MSKKARNFIFYTGYVESNSWACLAFRNSKGFNSVEEALQDFGGCILEGIDDIDEITYWAKCCRENIEKENGNYCSECGKSIKASKPDRETIEYYMNQFMTGNNDSIPHEFWETLAGHGWYLWGYNQDTDFKDVIIIGEKAESIIANAAFGRIFDEEEALAGWHGLDTKKYVKSSMYIPENMKVFYDDE